MSAIGAVDVRALLAGEAAEHALVPQDVLDRVTGNGAVNARWLAEENREVNRTRQG